MALQWDRERGWRDHAARDGGKAMFLGTRENSSPGSHDSLEHGSEELYRSFSIEDNLASTSRTVGRLLFKKNPEMGTRSCLINVHLLIPSVMPLKNLVSETVWRT